MRAVNKSSQAQHKVSFLTLNCLPLEPNRRPAPVAERAGEVPGAEGQGDAHRRGACGGRQAEGGEAGDPEGGRGQEGRQARKEAGSAPPQRDRQGRGPGAQVQRQGRTGGRPRQEATQGGGTFPNPLLLWPSLQLHTLTARVYGAH